MSAFADLAAKLGIDELEFFKRNSELTDRPEVYRRELEIAADLIGYKAKAHPRGDKASGPIRRGPLLAAPPGSPSPARLIRRVPIWSMRRRGCAPSSPPARTW